MTQKDLVWHECLVGLQGWKSKHQHHSKFALYTFYFTSFCNSLLQLLNGQTYQKRKVQKINGTMALKKTYKASKALKKSRLWRSKLRIVVTLAKMFQLSPKIISTTNLSQRELTISNFATFGGIFATYLTCRLRNKNKYEMKTTQI